MLTLKSIPEEAADCRARCANLKVGDLALHVHHAIFVERLTEPVENRIQYILDHKTDNVALRLRLLGPVVEDAAVLADESYRKAGADWDKARADWVKAYANWVKAHTDRKKAEADREKAYADWKKADAHLDKAYLPHYRRLFPGSPWDGETIFAGAYETKK